jgi:hypothetical protein
MPCDLACKTKIIINGGNAANLLNEVCYRVKELPVDVDITTSDKIIHLLNRIEDDACQVQRLFLQGIGYVGPFPKALS